VTRATLPPVALIAIEPVASGVGSGVVPPAPWDSCTRKNPPGATVPDSAVACHVEPEAEPYCTDRPVTSTGVEPRLRSSTKSLVYVAPELPPPP